MYPDVHLELHHALDDSADLDAATHLCLHAAGQFQPFYLPVSLQINTADVREMTPEIADSFLPETVPDRLYHPPRLFS